MLPTEPLEVFDYNSSVLFGIQLKLLLTKVSFEYVKRLLVMISEDINIGSLLNTNCCGVLAFKGCLLLPTLQRPPRCILS